MKEFILNLNNILFSNFFSLIFIIYILCFWSIIIYHQSYIIIFQQYFINIYANKYLDEQPMIILKGNNIFTGKLKNHDPFMNSVLEEDI